MFLLVLLPLLVNGHHCVPVFLCVVIQKSLSLVIRIPPRKQRCGELTLKISWYAIAKEGVEVENSTISSGCEHIESRATEKKKKSTEPDFVVDKDTNNIDYANDEDDDDGNDDDDNYVNGNGKWMW